DRPSACTPDGEDHLSMSETMSKNWYVVHTYAGYEGRVKTSILERASQMGLQDKIGQVLVPTEDVIEIKEGKKRTSTRKFFPGYVLVEMGMSNESWQMIKETPKVTGFVGGGAQPIPLTTEEVDTLLKQIDTGTAMPRQKDEFHKGDNVRIIDGPFLGFNGMVDDVDQERGRLKVLVSIFGRGTPVELGFLQVERL
ncbi:MAG: transcription termination/antitermination protein NusG, partial [Nitrospirota bacterium]